MKQTGSVARRSDRPMRIALLLTGIALLASGTVLVFLDKLGGAASTYGAGILSLVFAFLSNFSEFEGFGIKAKLLDRKIEEAEDLIQRLRATSVAMAEMIFSTTARLGRWGTALPRAESHRMIEAFEAELLKNGVQPVEIDSIKKDYHYFVMFDLAQPIVKYLGDLMKKKLEAVHKGLTAFNRPIDLNKDLDYVKLVEDQRAIGQSMNDLSHLYMRKDIERLAERVEEFVQSSKILLQEEKDMSYKECQLAWSDFKFYRDHHTFQSLDRWIEGEKHII